MRYTREQAQNTIKKMEGRIEHVKKTYVGHYRKSEVECAQAHIDNINTMLETGEYRSPGGGVMTLVDSK